MRIGRVSALVAALLSVGVAAGSVRSGPEAAPARPVQGGGPPPFNIAAEREALFSQYAAQRQAILDRVRAGQMTAAQGQAEIAAANQARFAQARARGVEADRVLAELTRRAQQIRDAEAQARRARSDAALAVNWEGVKNTGTPLSDPRSRGIFGDQDLTFASDADRAAFARAARERGFTVEGRLGEGYVTIRELDVVAHGPSTVPRDPLSPEARLQTHYRASGHESFAARGSRYPYLQEGSAAFSGQDALGAVADNIKKVEHDLRADVSRLRGVDMETWAQNLAKGTGRAMDAAGRTIENLQAQLARTTDPTDVARLQSELAFRQQLAALKTEMDPRATGLIPANASEAEAARLLQAFQDRCLRQYAEAYAGALESNRRLIAEMDGQIAAMLREGRTAAAANLAAERAAIIDGAAQAIQHLSTGDDAGRLLAEVALGGRLTPTVRNGVAGFLDARGNFVSQAEVRGVGARLLDEARANLRTTGAEPVGPRGWTATERGIIYVGAILAGIQGGLEERDAATREGREPSNILAALRGIWAMTGIQQSFEIGRDISRQNIEADFKRIEQMIREGQDPNVVRMALLTLAKTLGQVAGELTGVTSALHGGEEFWKLLGAAATELRGPPGDVNRLVEARKDVLLAAIDAEVSSLDAIVQAIDVVADVARARLEALDRANRRLADVLSRLADDRESITRIGDLCRANEGRRGEIARLKTAVADALKAAAEAGDDLRRTGDEICAYSRSAANTASAPPAPVAAAWRRAQDAKKKSDDAYAAVADRWGELDALAREFDDDDAMIEVLGEVTRPAEALEPAASAVELVRRAAADAAEPVATVLSLVQGLQHRANGVRIRTDLLINARVHVDRAYDLAARAQSIADQTGDHQTRMTAAADRIRDAAGGAYEALERAEADAATLDADLKAACPNRPQAVDRSDTDRAYRNSGAGLQSAARGFDSAKACADDVPGLTGSGFTSTAPSTVTTSRPAGPPPARGAAPAPPPRPAPKYTFWINESRCSRIEIGTVEELNTPRKRGGGECCGCALDARGAEEPMVRKQLGGEYATDKEAVAALCAMISRRTPAAPTDPWHSWYVEIGGKTHPWGGSCPGRTP